MVQGNPGWSPPSLHEAGRAYQLASNWMAQHVSGPRRFTQNHTALPVKIWRVSSLKWLGFQNMALGFAKPFRMNRHEETKRVVAALMSPVAEETMRLTDACWSPFLISSDLRAPPTPFGDADLIAFAGGLATRACTTCVFVIPLHLVMPHDQRSWLRFVLA